MIPTAEPTPSTAPAEATGPVVVALASNPARPPISFEATIRHPARFAAALAAFHRIVAAHPAESRTSLAPRAGQRGDYDCARRASARDLVARDPDLWPELPAVRPIVTVAEDAWIIEGFAADQSAYARISVDRGDFADEVDVRLGTTDVNWPTTFLRSLGSLRERIGGRLHLGHLDQSSRPEGNWPVGWLGGFAGMQAALSLPMRRVAIDRGGLFGLIAALGRSQRVRASRSVVVRCDSGQGATVEVRPGARPVRLHATAAEDGPQGSVRVAVGRHLADLAGLLPWVDSADLLLLGPGLPSGWVVRLGGIRLFLGLPSWTPDGRLGRLSLDPVEPPVEPGRFLANQVVATFRNHPAQSREQVIERTRGAAPEVAAVLTRLAGLALVLPEPETGLCRWRPAFAAAIAPLDDPEPSEATAARAINRTAAVQVTRDEVQPDGRGRRVEGLILDRPVTIDLDADGWLRRGRCTCSDHVAGGLAPGPCRHLLALQARTTRPTLAPAKDLATWFAGWPAPLTPP